MLREAVCCSDDGEIAVHWSDPGFHWVTICRHMMLIPATQASWGSYPQESGEWVLATGWWQCSEGNRTDCITPAMHHYVIYLPLGSLALAVQISMAPFIFYTVSCTRSAKTFIAKSKNGGLISYCFLNGWYSLLVNLYFAVLSIYWNCLITRQKS